MSNQRERLNKGRIDQKLESAESRKVSEAVGGLKDDELSMAWRSQLNAKLSAVSNEQKRSTFRLKVWSYSAGLGLSTVAAVAMLATLIPRNLPTANPASAETLESQMLTAHNSAVSSSDIAGEGLSSLDDTERISYNEAYDWKQEDLEAL